MNPQFAQIPSQQPASFGQTVVANAQNMPEQDAGADLSVSGMVFAFFMPPLGLLLSILGLKKSKKAGVRNRLALAGTIISSVTTALSMGILIFFISTLVTVSQKCGELGSGTHYLDSTTKIQCD